MFKSKFIMFIVMFIMFDLVLPCFTRQLSAKPRIYGLFTVLGVLPRQLWPGRRTMEAVDHITRERNHLRLFHVQLVAYKPQMDSNGPNLWGPNLTRKSPLNSSIKHCIITYCYTLQYMVSYRCE